jgi:twinkle protein
MEGIVDLEHVLPELFTLYRGGVDEGQRLGLATDEIFRWHSPCLLILTGYPNSGKSSFWDQVMVNASHLYSVKHAIFSSESGGPAKHAKKLIMKYVGKRFIEPDNINYGMSKEEARKGYQWVKDHFKWIRHPSRMLNIDEILEYADYMRCEYGCTSLIIDPWNSVDSTGKSENDSNYICQCLDKVRNFNEKHNFLTCIVAHPAKTSRDTRGRYPVPTANDIHGSYGWRAKADVILCFHREDMTSNRNQVHCQKIREVDFGMIGSVETDWDKISGRFKKTNDDYYDLPYRYGEEPAYE